MYVRGNPAYYHPLWQKSAENDLIQFAERNWKLIEAERSVEFATIIYDEVGSAEITCQMGRMM